MQVGTPHHHGRYGAKLDISLSDGSILVLELGRADTSVGVDASGSTVVLTTRLHECGYQFNLDGRPEREGWIRK